MRRRHLLALLALLAALLAVPSVSAQPSPYATLTITESLPGLPDDTFVVSCDWYPAEQARALIDAGSYQVILPGNHGWLFCN